MREKWSKMMSKLPHPSSRPAQPRVERPTVVVPRIRKLVNDRDGLPNANGGNGDGGHGG